MYVNYVIIVKKNSNAYQKDMVWDGLKQSSLALPKCCDDYHVHHSGSSNYYCQIRLCATSIFHIQVSIK